MKDNTLPTLSYLLQYKPKG